MSENVLKMFDWVQLWHALVPLSGTIFYFFSPESCLVSSSDTHGANAKKSGFSILWKLLKQISCFLKLKNFRFWRYWSETRYLGSSYIKLSTDVSSISRFRRKNHRFVLPQKSYMPNFRKKWIPKFRDSIQIAKI